MAEHQPGTLSNEVDDLIAQAHIVVSKFPKDMETLLPESVVMPDIEAENWISKLREDEVFNGDEGPSPRLHGLRRLARPYILSERSQVNALLVVPRQVVKTLEHKNGDGNLMSTSDVLSNQNFPMASVTFYVTLKDGRTFSDSADAYYLNCNDLGLFPTAVASARAEARTLRKVLGIKQHAAEELTDKDSGEELAPDDDSPIKPEQVKLIERMLTQQSDITLKDVLTNITTREVFAVDDLTTGEARKALRTLNDMKKGKKKKEAKK